MTDGSIIRHHVDTTWGHGEVHVVGDLELVATQNWHFKTERVDGTDSGRIPGYELGWGRSLPG